MGFKKTEFKTAKLVHRESDVPVPGLSDWFEITDEQQAELDKLTGADREKYLTETVGCVWKVRGLTDDELQRAAENAQGQRQKLAEAVAVLIDGKSPVDEIVEQLGAGQNATFMSALRMEHVRTGSVDPVIDQATAVRLSKAFPVEFRQIENKIMELTGLGQVAEKKLEPSGKTKGLKAA